MVLIRLDKVEIRSKTLLETIMSVKLELSEVDGVASTHGGSVAFVHIGQLGGVIGPLVALGASTGELNEGVVLDNPDKFLNWVVEGELDLVG